MKYAHDAADRLVRVSYPDGVRLDFTYDAAGRRTSVTTTTAAGASSVSYAYDAAGRMSLLQLFWVFDEMFATADAWSSVFQPLGVACRPVVSRQGAELKTVVQLLVDEECEVSSNGLAFEACTRCHRPKYTRMDRGPLPTLKREPSCAIARTSAYFGSGGEAYKLILVSQELIHAILAAKLRGVHFTPCLQDVGAQEWASRSNRGPSPSSQ